MKIGYIKRYDLTLNPHLTERFKFLEATCTRVINTRGDRIKSKMLMFPVDYEDILGTTNEMRQDGLIIVDEPFLLDEELKTKAIKWVEWANKADPKLYDPFYTEETTTENMED